MPMKLANAENSTVSSKVIGMEKEKSNSGLPPITSG